MTSSTSRSSSLLSISNCLISSRETSTPRCVGSLEEAHHEEAVPLAEELARVRKQRGSGPHPLGTILPAILAEPEVDLVRSTESGEADPTE